jgi:hypothetical protein
MIRLNSIAEFAIGLSAFRETSRSPSGIKNDSPLAWKTNRVKWSLVSGLSICWIGRVCLESSAHGQVRHPNQASQLDNGTNFALYGRIMSKIERKQRIRRVLHMPQSYHFAPRSENKMTGFHQKSFQESCESHIPDESRDSESYKSSLDKSNRSDFHNSSHIYQRAQ